MHAHRNSVQTLKRSHSSQIFSHQFNIFITFIRSSKNVSFLHWCVWGRMLTARVEYSTGREDRSSKRCQRPCLQFALILTVFTLAAKWLYNYHQLVEKMRWLQTCNNVPLETIWPKPWTWWAFKWQERTQTVTLSPIKMRWKISGGRRTHPLLRECSTRHILTINTQNVLVVSTLSPFEW